MERRIVPLVEGIDASPFGYVVANHSKPSFIGLEGVNTLLGRHHALSIHREEYSQSEYEKYEEATPVLTPGGDGSTVKIRFDAER